MSETTSKTPLTIKDFPEMCRICLGNESEFPIFYLMVDNVKGTDLLEYSVDLKTNRGDNLPEKICETCVKELFRIFKFKRQCQENDAILKLLLEENSEYDRETTTVTLLKTEDEGFNQLHEIAEDDKCETERKKTTAQDLPYQCKDCLQKFTTSNEFHVHAYNVHNCKRFRPCEVCNKFFKSTRMSQHMRTHTGEKPHQCNVCSRSFSIRTNLKRHQMLHTGEKPHVCGTCGKGFLRSESLQIHEKSHKPKSHKPQPKTRFSCEQCSRTFKRETNFAAHLKTHAKKLGVGRNFPVADSSSLRHVCEICGRAYKTRNCLRTHMLTHGEIKFVCNECGKGFYIKLNFQNHMRIHTGEKPYKCSVCDKSFSHDSSLASHLLVHSGYKPFGCSQCPKTFKQRTHLIYHLRTHTGEKPYACTFCGKAFAVKGNLMVHLRTHTGETPYVCPVCKKGFYDSSSMKKHMKIHTKKKAEQDGEKGES